MYGDCTSCEGLWDEYSDATIKHIAIEGKLQIARLEHNSAVINELIPKVETARVRCEEAKKAFREHRASHKSKTLKAEFAG